MCQNLYISRFVQVLTYQTIYYVRFITHLDNKIQTQIKQGALLLIKLGGTFKCQI